MRLLKGQDPDPDKLEEDCEKLEERLAEQEQKLLEKELILEEETRLTDRVTKKVSLENSISDFPFSFTRYTVHTLLLSYYLRHDLHY